MFQKQWFFFWFFFAVWSKKITADTSVMSHQNTQNIIIMGKKKGEVIRIIVGVNGCK